MRVGIVGTGFTGLSAAYRLAQQGVEVVLFEISQTVGGLASGFSLPGWKWPIEQFYHHIFFNDDAIIRLAREVNWPASFFRPTTSIYFNGGIHPFDSAWHLLRFPHLPLGTKLRMGAVLGFLKISPFWKPLERIPADEFLIQTMGIRGYEAVWKPLLLGKFRARASEINASWFWSRIQKRTARLGYFQGGFQGLADRLYENIKSHSGVIQLNCPVKAIHKRKLDLEISSKEGIERFDRVLVTTNTPLFLKMVPGLPTIYRKLLSQLHFLDVLSVILILRKPVMNGVYWLNVLESGFPFLVVVEHTNMIAPEYYGGNHIIYLGAYLPSEHQYFRLSKEAVIQLALKQLKETAANFKKSDIKEVYVHRGYHAQPIIPVNYSSICPTMETPIDDLFLANMNMVYPWDRGTNYAVELGERAAALILKN